MLQGSKADKMRMLSMSVNERRYRKEYEQLLANIEKATERGVFEYVFEAGNKPDSNGKLCYIMNCLKEDGFKMAICSESSIRVSWNNQTKEKDHERK